MDWQQKRKQWKAETLKSASPDKVKEFNELTESGLATECEAFFLTFGWRCPAFENIWHSRPKDKMTDKDALKYLINVTLGLPCDGSKKIELQDERVKKILKELFAQAFIEGHIETSATKDEKGWQKYAGSQFSKHLREDPDFNGGDKYEAETSRTPGQNVDDPKIKKLRLLIKDGRLSGTQKKRVMEELNSRINELKLKKN